MRISHSSYSKYLVSIKEELINQKFNSALLYNSKTLVIPYMEKAKEVLIIDLNSKQPLFFKAKSDMFFSSFENKFIDKYRKLIGKSMLKGFELAKDDLLITLNLQSLETFDQYSLVIQLIPNNPNLFLLDESGKLIAHYFSSKNKTFEIGKIFEIEKNSNFVEGEFEVNDQLFIKLLEEEKDARNKDKYGPFLKFMNNKIKGANKRIKAIENDVDIASKNLIFKEIADEILSTETNLKTHKESLVFNGEKIALDSSKTLLENANHFYHKTKKAKETISRSQINIENAQKEKQEYAEILREFAQGNEKQKDELVQTYFNFKKKKEIKKTNQNRPWKVNLNGTIIYFGRNASQNDYLSFVMKIDREFTWLHIKDKSGAHLIIANKKPTENELLTACELALLCSRCTSGEITYTKKKNVRRGHVLGEALVKNYSNIKLNNVRKETIDLLEKAVRLD